MATAALLAPQSGNAIGPVLPLGDSQHQCAELANLQDFKDHRGRDRGSSLIPFGQVHPASRVRIAGRCRILKIVPDYPAKDRWIHAFKGTDGSTLDRVEMRCP